MNKMSRNVTCANENNAFNVWNKPGTWTGSGNGKENDAWPSVAMTNVKPGCATVGRGDQNHQHQQSSAAATSNVIGQGNASTNGVTMAIGGYSVPGAELSSSAMNTLCASNGSSSVWSTIPQSEGQAQVPQNSKFWGSSSSGENNSSIGSALKSPSLWGVPTTSFSDTQWGNSPTESSQIWSKPSDSNSGWGTSSSAEVGTTDSGDSKPAVQNPSKDETTDGATPTNTPKPNQVSSEENPELLEKEEYIQRLINTTEHWGQRPINQSTPWDTGEPETKMDQEKQQLESNVWASEPPNGTGVWEAYYESIGEKTAHWKSMQSDGVFDMRANANTPTNPWPDKASDSSPFWNESANQSRASSWFDGPPTDASNRMHRTNSIAGTPSTWNGPGEEPGWGGSEWNYSAASRRENETSNNWDASSVGAWGQGSKGSGNESGGMWPNQNKMNHSNFHGNGPTVDQWGESSMSGQMPPSMGSISMQQRGGMPPNNGRRIGNGNRMTNMRVHAIKYLMDLGFKKEDAQAALISHNMDVERAIAELQATKGRGGGGASFEASHNLPNGDAPAPGGPRMIRGAGPGSMPPNNMNPQQQQQQQMMRQQIMAQLRTAVQNKLIHPNVLNAQSNLSIRDLQLFQQLIQHQQAEATLKQRLQALNQQIRNANAMQKPALLQQYETGMAHLNSVTQQLAAFSAKLSVGQRPNGVTQPPAQQVDNLAQQLSDFKWQSGGEGGPTYPPGQQGVNSRVGSMSRLDMPWKNPGDVENKMPPNYGRSMSMHTNPGSNMNEMAYNAAANNPASAHVAAQVAAAVVDVAEFVPGKPWQGKSSLLNADDPTITPARDVKGLFSTVNNDRLEKLAISEVDDGQFWTPSYTQSYAGAGRQSGFQRPNEGQNSMPPQAHFQPHSGMPNTNRPSWTGGPNASHQPGQMSMGGRGYPAFPNNSTGHNSMISAWLVVRNLNGNSVEFARSVCQSQSSLTAFNPNPHAGWALACFSNREEAHITMKMLAAQRLPADLLNDHEAALYLKELANATAIAAQMGGMHHWAAAAGMGQSHGDYSMLPAEASM